MNTREKVEWLLEQIRIHFPDRVNSYKNALDICPCNYSLEDWWQPAKNNGMMAIALITMGIHPGKYDTFEILKEYQNERYVFRLICTWGKNMACTPGRPIWEAFIDEVVRLVDG